MEKSTEPNYKELDLANITTYQAGVIQSTAFRVINKVTATMLKEYNLSTMQWFIVGTVYDAGDDGISITDLSRKLDTGISFLTNSINVLELKNMVIRREHSKDNRIRLVHINPSFRPKCTKIEKRLREKMRTTLYDRITRDELNTYIKVLNQLASL